MTKMFFEKNPATQNFQKYSQIGRNLSTPKCFLGRLVSFPRTSGDKWDLEIFLSDPNQYARRTDARVQTF
jgi:hypothetical protein